MKCEDCCHAEMCKWIDELEGRGCDFFDGEQEPCDDAISRILKKMWNCRGKHTTSIDKVAMEQIIRDELPSVTQKSGKWIRWREEVQRGTHYMENVPHCKCSECDKEYDTYTSRFIKYCPNCGAKMVEPQESEDKTK